jgi:hypothetical protein
MRAMLEAASTIEAMQATIDANLTKPDSNNAEVIDASTA